jgi:toxin ParE1/3/4
MKIFVSEAADTDLLQIYDYLHQRNPTAAESLMRQIDLKFESLSRFPFIGRPREALRPGLRSILAGNYVIFYEVADDQVTIVRVLHGRRDIDAEFQR